MYRNIRFRFDTAYLEPYKTLLVPLGLIVAATALIYTAISTSELATIREAEAEAEFRRKDAFFLIFFLTAIPFIPYLVFLLRRFVIDHMHYGPARGKFVARAWEFYKIYLKGFVLMFGSVFVIGILFGFVIVALGLSDTFEQGATAEDAAAAMTMPVIAIVIGIYAIGFYLLGYVNSRLTNATFNGTEIGPLLLHSTLRGRELGNLYLTNTIAVVLGLGLMVPWVKIRMARYKASRTEFLAKDMAGIEAIEQSDQSTLGEELGDMLDVDIGL